MGCHASISITLILLALSPSYCGEVRCEGDTAESTARCEQTLRLIHTKKPLTWPEDLEVLSKQRNCFVDSMRTCSGVGGNIKELSEYVEGLLVRAYDAGAAVELQGGLLVLMSAVAVNQILNRIRYVN